MAKPAALQGIDPFAQPERPDYQPPRNIAELQAAVEGVPVGDRLTFKGQTYRVADKQGAMPLMRFAHAAKRGLEVDSMEGLAAMYDMLRDCIHEDDWARFEADATDKKADGDDFLDVVTQAVELMTARPTQRPSDSSERPSTTSPSSTESSPSPAIPNGQVTEKLYRIEDLIPKD